jgi:hypothetical protein
VGRPGQGNGFVQYVGSWKNCGTFWNVKEYSGEKALGYGILELGSSYGHAEDSLV